MKSGRCTSQCPKLLNVPDLLKFSILETLLKESFPIITIHYSFLLFLSSSFLFLFLSFSFSTISALRLTLAIKPSPHTTNFFDSFVKLTETPSRQRPKSLVFFQTSTMHHKRLVQLIARFRFDYLDRR